MSSVRRITLPGVETVPRSGTGHLSAARDIATIALGLLQASDAALLAIAIPSDGWGTRAPVLLWDHSLRRREDRTRILWDEAIYQPAMDALCIAADALFDQMFIARMCDADTGGLCIVTDGVGVTLSAQPPTLDDDGGAWLLALAGGTGAPVMTGRAAANASRRGGTTPLAATVIPLAATGLWGLLAIDATHASRH